MATGDYCTDTELQDRLSEAGLSTRNRDAIPAVITSASREVDAFCARAFYQVDTVDAVYYVDALTDREVYLPFDLYAITSVAVDMNDDSTWATALTMSTDYLTEPLNGISGGLAGWPTESLRGLRRPQCFMPYVRYHNTPAVKITGKRGWSAVPAPVKQAALIIATETFKLREAPFGVAGFGDFGVVRIKDNPVVARMLEPYQRVSLAIA